MVAAGRVPAWLALCVDTSCGCINDMLHWHARSMDLALVTYRDDDSACVVLHGLLQAHCYWQMGVDSNTPVIITWTSSQAHAA